MSVSVRGFAGRPACCSTEANPALSTSAPNVALLTSDGRTAGRGLRGLVWLGLLLPVFLSLNFVVRFAVDVPFWDQWELVPQISRMYAGTLRFADLYLQHNEHRILVPRLVMLGLVRLTGWDTRFEMFVGWLLLLATAVVLLVEYIRALGRDVGSLLRFLPIAWLVFTLRQFENLLWGWQLQVFLAAFGVVASMALLCSGKVTPRRTLLAILCAEVSSFSFAAGLAVWPAGAAAILARREARWQRLGLWLGSVGLTLLLYLPGYHRPAHHPNPGYFASHLARSAYFFLAMLGGSLVRDTEVATAAAVGLVLLGLCVILFLLWRRGELDLGRVGIGLPLVVFAAVSAAMATVGRVGFEYGTERVGMALSSRYTTLTLLGVYGVYRASLVVGAERWRQALLGSMVTMLFIGTFLELQTSYALGAAVRNERRRMQQLLVTWRTRPDSELGAIYLPFSLRERIPEVERLQLSVFRPRQ